jgi:hypothetical protein
MPLPYPAIQIATKTRGWIGYDEEEIHSWKSWAKPVPHELLVSG